MTKIKPLYIIFFLLFANFSFFANVVTAEEIKNDYLYSSEYFDYLIECASMNRQKQEDEQKALKKAATKHQKSDKNKQTGDFVEEIAFDSEEPDFILIEDAINEKYEPFKLHIEEFSKPNKYKEAYKKEDSKISIRVNDKLSYFNDMSKTRNKYNSQDYKILAGIEYSPLSFLKFAGGLETNYRGLDQNPNSRKLYITPKLSLGDKVSVVFPNKVNISSHSTDHDIGLNVSPFKSKLMDFGVYGGVTRTSAGKTSESINFTTNLYFF